MKTDFENAKNLFTYEEYKDYIIKRFEEGKATGEIQNEARISATKINLHRIKRLDKTIKINEELSNVLLNLNRPLKLYLITEGWCGDSAQLTSIIAKATEISDNITFKILLRDENPEIMDKYLTNGGRAIPKLICVDAETREDLWTWGPRPTKIQQMVAEYKEKYTLDDHDEFVKNLHLWYARDKGNAMQEDLIRLFKTIKIKKNVEI